MFPCPGCKRIGVVFRGFVISKDVVFVAGRVLYTGVFYLVADRAFLLFGWLPARGVNFWLSAFVVGGDCRVCSLHWLVVGEGGLAT